MNLSLSLWPLSNLHHISRAPTSSTLSFKLYLTKLNLMSLFPTLTSSLRLLGIFKLRNLSVFPKKTQNNPPQKQPKKPKRWKNETIFRWFIFSSFLICWFGSIFEEYVCIRVYTFEKVEFPLFVMSCMTFYFPGWSRSLWAQRRTWRKWLCCKTRHNFYLTPTFNHSLFVLFVMVLISFCPLAFLLTPFPICLALFICHEGTTRVARLPWN